MLLLSALPSSSSTLPSSSSTPFISTTADDAPLAPLARILPRATESRPVAAGGVIELDSIETVAQVRVGDRVYNRGEFVQEGDRLIIAGVESEEGEYALVSGVSSSPVVSLAQPSEFDLPSSLAQLSVSGEISISRSFESHPQMDFQFYAPTANLLALRQAMPNNSVHQIFGSLYRLQNLEVSFLQNEGMCAVSASFVGAHEWSLQQPISQRQATSVSAACGLLGIGYEGEAIAIPVSREATSRDYITLDSEFQPRTRSVESFAYYSSASGIEARKWGQTRTHLLADSDFLAIDNTSFYSVSYNGQGAWFQNVQLSDEYKKTKLELDRSDESENEESDRFRNVYLDLYEGDPQPELYPQGVFVSSEEEEEGGESGNENLDFRSASIWFDQGGITKTRSRALRLNGQPLLFESETWGFEGSSLDIYNRVPIPNSSFLRPVLKSSIDPANYWKQIEYKRIDYIYDKDGYLIQEKTSGYRRYRFEQEQNSEAVMEACAPDFDQEIVDLYSDFSWLAIAAISAWELAPFRPLYPDVKPPEDEDERRDWVEPKYVISSIKTDYSTKSRNDPRATAEEPLPDLVTGKAFREESHVTIGYPYSAIREAQWSSEQEIYTVRSITQNSENGGLKDSLTIESFEDIQGRPQVHTRLEKFEEQTTISIGSPAQETEYFLFSEGRQNENHYSTDSVSFAGASTWENAIAAAKVDLSIRNAQNAEIWSVKIKPNWKLEEGDLINWRGILYVVLSVSQQFAVAKGSVFCPHIQIEVGRYLEIPIEIASE